MIKFIVIDLDGTLLDQDHCISQQSIHVLQQLNAKGLEIILATGRHYQDVYLLAQQLDFPCWLITSNGARVHNPANQLVYENHIPSHLIAEILSLSAGFEVHRNIYQQDLWLVEEANEPLLQIHHSSGFAYRMCDFAKLDFRHIDKFYFNAAYERLKPLYEQLLQRFDDQLYITFTTDIYLEVMNKGVSKGSALSQVLTALSIETDQVMAFGDGLNDLDMLKLVGHPVIMANAHPNLKQQIPHANQALSNQQQGVAQYLTQHFL